MHRLAPAAAPRWRARRCRWVSMSFRWSYFVPFLLRRVVLRRRRLCRLLPLLQFLADHSDFEQNSSRFDLLTDGFELLRRDFLRTMRDVQEDTLEFIERAGK